MSPAPISRRGLVVGTGAVLAAVAIPAGVVEAAAEVPSTVEFEALAAVFDPAAFCRDLLDAGFHVTARRPVRTFLSDDEYLRPGYHITPADGGGFGRRYLAVMRRWSEAMDACSDHVEQVVAYAFGRLMTET